MYEIPVNHIFRMDVTNTVAYLVREVLEQALLKGTVGFDQCLDRAARYKLHKNAHIVHLQCGVPKFHNVYVLELAQDFDLLSHALVLAHGLPRIGLLHFDLLHGHNLPGAEQSLVDQAERALAQQIASLPGELQIVVKVVWKYLNNHKSFKSKLSNEVK
jgi:hypothetical protein